MAYYGRGLDVAVDRPGPLPGVEHLAAPPETFGELPLATPDDWLLAKYLLQHYGVELGASFRRARHVCVRAFAPAGLLIVGVHLPGMLRTLALVEAPPGGALLLAGSRVLPPGVARMLPGGALLHAVPGSAGSL